MKSLLVLAFSFFVVVCFGQKNTPTGVRNPAGPSRPPDLIVKSFAQTGAPFNGPNGTIHVPVTVTVKNNGLSAAAIFKTGVDYNHPNGQIYPVAFTATGQRNIWYPLTTAPLAAGSSVVYQGVLAFQNTLRGSTLSVKAIADTCSGDEFMESYCRVVEISETNNASAAIQIVLR